MPVHAWRQCRTTRRPVVEEQTVCLATLRVEPTTPDFSDDLPVSADVIKQAERNLKKGAEMQPYVAKVLMKALYAARYARLDLLRVVCHLAQFTMKWDTDCDACPPPFTEKKLPIATLIVSQ